MDIDAQGEETTDNKDGKKGARARSAQCTLYSPPTISMFLPFIQADHFLELITEIA